MNTDQEGKVPEKNTLHEQFKTMYDELWKEYVSNPDAILSQPTKEKYNLTQGYCVSGYFCKNQPNLLFIGFNPAYNEKTDSVTGINIFENRNSNLYPTYFSKFDDLCEATLGKPNKSNWTSLDVLSIRSTDQKSIEKEIDANPVFNDFCFEQVELFKKVLDHVVTDSKPKAIIVCSARARSLLMTKPLQSKAPLIDLKSWDEKKGVFYYQSSKSEKTPVIFTSMLSGQRALDLGSYCSLAWHIRNI